MLHCRKEKQFLNIGAFILDVAKYTIKNFFFANVYGYSPSLFCTIPLMSCCHSGSFGDCSISIIFWNRKIPTNTRKFGDGKLTHIDENDGMCTRMKQQCCRAASFLCGSGSGSGKDVDAARGYGSYSTM
jgi:hypothetical protein